MNSNLRHSTVTGAAAAIALALALAPASASATPSNGFQPSGIVNGHFGTLNVNTAGDKTDKWGMVLKTHDDTDIGADRLTVQPQGFSGWHAHPAPVFVTVTQGTIQWYDAALCTPRTYSAGQSFIEPAYATHNVRNPAAAGGTVAEYVAIIIRPEGYVGPAFRLDRGEPSAC